MNEFRKREIKNRLWIGSISFTIYCLLGLAGAGFINWFLAATGGYVDRWEKVLLMAIFVVMHTLAYITATGLSFMFRQKSLDWSFGDMGPTQLKQIQASIEEVLEEKEITK